MDLKQQIDEAAAVIQSLCPLVPEIGIVLGTGLGTLTAKIENAVTIPYDKIPHFPASTVESHAGELVLGTLAGKPVIAVSGRFHFYEGYTMKQVTFPVRVARALGIHTLVVTNAAGGMNPQFAAGDLMLITDHINLMGDNPLIGPNDEALGPRFPDMCEPYAKGLLALAETVALEERIALRRGVFLAVPGPCLETAAEYRFMRMIGGDAVGMSTVPEVIVAVHAGLRVLGVSVITDECLPDALAPVDIARIIATANAAEPRLSALIRAIVGRM